MTNMWKDEDEGFWYSGKVTRRRLVGWGGGILGAAMLVPAPWRAAFGNGKPFKVGSLQPLTGPAAPGGKTAVVGLQMAVDRINKAGGIHGRPVDLILADTQSKPDVGRRQAQKLVDEDQVDVSCGTALTHTRLAGTEITELVRARDDTGDHRVPAARGIAANRTPRPRDGGSHEHSCIAYGRLVGRDGAEQRR